MNGKKTIEIIQSEQQEENRLGKKKKRAEPQGSMRLFNKRSNI